MIFLYSSLDFLNLEFIKTSALNVLMILRPKIFSSIIDNMYANLSWPFFDELFKLLPMYPIKIPAIGNSITTNTVRWGLIKIKVDRYKIIEIGSLKNISKAPIIDHSISTKSDVILEVKSPFLFEPMYATSNDNIFLCKSILMSWIIPFLIGVKKKRARYLNRFFKKNIDNTKTQISIKASTFPFVSIVLLIK